jgi:sec-independent protein translocase protein TatC
VIEVEEARMSFLDHLGELRRRLIRAFIAVLIAFLGCVAFSERLFQVISAPIVRLLPKDTGLVFTGLPDPFFIYLKVSFIAGIFIALPYCIYEMWKFVYPGLHKHERKLAIPFIMSATLLFYAGAAFAYFLVFPAAFKFFLGFQTAELKAMISIREYVHLVLMLTLAFAGIFETPILIVFLGLLGVVSSGFLKSGRRYFVVLAFIIAAFLTPTPDVINQTLMAVPLIFFYEVGIQVLGILERRREREDEAEEDDEEAEDSSGEGSSQR